MNFKVALPKSLPPLPKLDKHQIQGMIEKLDLRALAIGIGITLVFYTLINIFVWLKATSTIDHLKSQLPSTHTTITKAEPKPTTKQHNEPEESGKFIIAGLSTKTSAGNLPIIRKTDYLTSFRAYQAPFTFSKTDNRPIISFIIKDYGLSARGSNLAAKELPAEISLMLSPYASKPSSWVNRAHNKGHEVWMHMPMQNEKTTDQGPNTVFHHASLNDKQTAIYKTLSKTLGYVGLSAHTDESFKTAKEEYSQIFDEIYNRGLGYLELNPDAPSLIEGKAFAKGAPYIKADIEVLRMTGKDSFNTLENIANKQGYAVATIPNYPFAINNLISWLEKAGSIDYQIAPISAIYDIPTQRDIKPAALHRNDLTEPHETHHDESHHH